MKVFSKGFYIKTFTFFLLCGLSISSTFAQAFTYAEVHPVNNLDSLKTWLSKNPKPTIQRLKALIQYERSNYYVTLRMDKAYLDEIEKISSKLKNRTGMASLKLLKTTNSVFEQDLNGTIKLLGELRLEFEELNDYSGQIYTYLTLYSIYLKINSSSQYTSLQLAYLQKAQEILRQHPNVYDQSNIYLSILFSALTQKQNDLVLSNISLLKELYKNNRCLAYLGNILKMVEDLTLKTVTESDIDKRVSNAENVKSNSGVSYVQKSYLFNICGEYYYKHKKYTKALVTFKKSIENAKQSPVKNYELLLQAYQVCKNIEQLENKNYEVVNMLSDSILKYTKLLDLQRIDFEISNFQTQYGLKKAELESEIFSKNIILSKKEKDELERNLQLQRQEALNVILKSKLNINQKELELTKASLTNTRLEENAVKIKNENFYLYIIVGLLIIFFSMFVYFYNKRIKANRELNQLINDREKLMAIIAHDLKSPITNLMTTSTSIKYLLKNNRMQDLTVLLDSVENQANNTSLLINNLFEWGKMKSYRQNEDFQMVDIGGLIHDIVGQYKSVIEAKRIDLSLDIPEQIYVNTNLKALSIILRNLIDNAQKFTPENGKITIQIKKDKFGGKTLICIKDTGDGFTLEKVQFVNKIFDNNVKVKVGSEGLGLGLILISEFSRKINSSISLESTIGEGSNFKLLI